MRQVQSERVCKGEKASKSKRTQSFISIFNLFGIYIVMSSGSIQRMILFMINVFLMYHNPFNWKQTRPEKNMTNIHTKLKRSEDKPQDFLTSAVSSSLHK